MRREAVEVIVRVRVRGANGKWEKWKPPFRHTGSTATLELVMPDQLRIYGDLENVRPRSTFRLTVDP